MWVEMNVEVLTRFRRQRVEISVPKIYENRGPHLPILERARPLIIRRYSLSNGLSLRISKSRPSLDTSHNVLLDARGVHNYRECTSLVCMAIRIDEPHSLVGYLKLSMLTSKVTVPQATILQPLAITGLLVAKGGFPLVISFSSRDSLFGCFVLSLLTVSSLLRIVMTPSGWLARVRICERMGGRGCWGRRSGV